MYKIGDLFVKNINDFGIFCTTNFYQIVDILEEGYIIEWIEFIKEIINLNNDTNTYTYKYIVRYFSKQTIVDKNSAGKYFRYNITGKISFQDILKIKDSYKPELAYKIIYKKFQTFL